VSGCFFLNTVYLVHLNLKYLTSAGGNNLTIFPQMMTERSLPGGGTAISGGGTPDRGGGTPFRPVPAEFNHCEYKVKKYCQYQ